MSLTYKSYNPDVLNCLANLSSDEVFTPPRVANDMLDMLPADFWTNPNATFLDPVSKSGIFLREITKRLLKGLESQIPDLQERLNHILSKQVFGIAITELTSLMSRRSLYCSKHANGEYSICTALKDKEGNIKYQNIEHTWDNRGKCIYCGASAELYMRGEKLEYHAYQFIHTETPNEIYNKMKFDVIIGNPPYQLDDGGAQASAMPIYQLFVQQSIKLRPRYISMIIPSRWFSGGRSILDEFREEMINDHRIAQIHDFEDASECFPNVEIKGGVNYFLWERDKLNSQCHFYSYKNHQLISQMYRPLKVQNVDVLIRHNSAINILNKILKQNEESFADKVNSAMFFGLRTFFKDYKSLNDYKGSVKVFGNRSIGFVDQNIIKKNRESINKWKVIIPEAVGVGDMQKDVLKPILAGPGSVNTETYIMNGPYDSEREALNVITYIKTKFFHFLVGLIKNTHHTTQKVYRFVPMQDFTKPWTDKELYKKYNLTCDEVDFIESMVRTVE